MSRATLIAWSVRLLSVLSVTIASGAWASAWAQAAPSAGKGVEIPKESGVLDEASATRWYPATALGIAGRGWDDTKSPFDRLPGRAEEIVRKPVWELSRQSAGLAVRFATTAPSIQVRWTLTSTNLAMPHMPATGVSGLDLYVRTSGGAWRWLANGRPTQVTNTATLVSNLPKEPREYLLYFPLYNGLKSLEIGLPEGNTLAKASPPSGAAKGPIVVWGTSITQGGCASRPGMVHTSILGRRLDYDVINLGFSGNGKMEPELARLIAEIPASAFVVDCLPNMTAAEVTERTGNVVRILREKHPRTPIVLVEDRDYTDAHLVASKRERNLTSRAALRKVFDQLKQDGVGDLHYLVGEGQVGDDSEGTVDSSHPTDLGFVRMADAFEKVLRPLVSAPNAK